MNNNHQQRRQGGDASSASSAISHQQRLQRHRQQQQQQQQMMEKLNQLKAQYVSDYSLPLNYPANVTSLLDASDDNTSDASKSKQNEPSLLRTDQDFINARLLEAGVPLGGGVPDLTPTSQSKMTITDHNASIARFIHDLEGTRCYDAVQVYLGNNNEVSTSGNQDDGATSTDSFDVTVRLKEKKWYKLYIGGGVNSEDLSSFGGTSGMGNTLGGPGGAALGILPKLQFETSASLLNLTGFADVSTALYSVDQTGASSFKFTHDRPLCSWLPKHSSIREWLMPPDPRLIDPEERNASNGQSADSVDENQVFVADDAQYSLGGGSHTSLGIHAMVHDLDFESTRSSKEFVRSIGVRLANHCRGAAGGSNKPGVSPPEAMAGPYLFLDWNASLRDTMPRRNAEFPFALDCSKEVASQAGTVFKHSLAGGMYLNGCFTDDRYDPTMGYDAHVLGEVAGPPGDVGFWKLKGGGSWHLPLELIGMMAFGVNEEEYTSKEEDESPVVIGATLHSSFNAGLIRPLSFSGLCNSGSIGGVPSSDKFYVGGPGQLRGFLPSGIGPRSAKGGSSVPGGDSLGGDVYYTTTLAGSIPFPSYFATLRQNGARVFGFTNVGTCVSAGGSVLGMPAFSQILQSSRVAVGGGVSVGSPMGRFEATYAVPMRYGPRDATKAVQFGFGFSFG